jgi:hypothetical protein
MSKIPEFYSVNETSKPPANRVHHNNGECRPGQDIPQSERSPGTGGYRLCEKCEELNQQKR